jgi:hypothetical protein
LIGAARAGLGPAARLNARPASAAIVAPARARAAGPARRARLPREFRVPLLYFASAIWSVKGFPGLIYGKYASCNGELVTLRDG